MPSWQSNLFRQFARLSRPRVAGAATDIAELRRQYTYLTDRFGPAPSEVAFEPGQVGPIKGEWVKSGAGPAERLILYFHGGGYIAGSPETHRPLIGRLALAAEAHAFVPAYRLAPEFAFPAAVRDGIDAYRHLIAKGVDPKSMVVAGDGSGGGLAFAVLLAIRNAGLETPAAAVAMSPWTDLSLSGLSPACATRTTTPRSPGNCCSCPRGIICARPIPPMLMPAPVFATFNDFPPIMVHAGSHEILQGRRQPSRRSRGGGRNAGQRRDL